MFNFKKILNVVSAVILAISIVFPTNIFALEISNQNNDNRYKTVTKADIERMKKEQLKKWDEIDKKYKGKNGVNEYITQKGLILVTKDGSSGSFIGHAAIMYSISRIVESMPDDKGVVGKSSGVFENDNNWDQIHDTCYISRPKNTSSSQRENVANWCHDQIGKHYIMPYNCFWTWKNIRDKFYCSHLVWAGYHDAEGVDLAPGADMVLFPNDLLNDSFVEILYVK